MLEKELIETIVKERIKMGITMTDMAKKLGVSKSNIYRFEKNIHSPTIRLLKKYLEALDLELVIVDHK